MTFVAREVLVRCDKCGEPGAEGWKIVNPDGETFDIDLDTQHSKPLRDLLKFARKAQGAKVTSLRSGTGSSLDSRWRNVPEGLAGNGGD